MAQPTQHDDSGARVHQLKPPYREKETTLRGLLHDQLGQGERCRVLFVLPVHEDGLFKHGDAPFEMQQLGIHNEHRLICVAPAFTSKSCQT